MGVRTVNTCESRERLVGLAQKPPLREAFAFTAISSKC